MNEQVVHPPKADLRYGMLRERGGIAAIPGGDLGANHGVCAGRGAVALSAICSRPRGSLGQGPSGTDVRRCSHRWPATKTRHLHVL